MLKEERKRPEEGEKDSEQQGRWRGKFPQHPWDRPSFLKTVVDVKPSVPVLEDVQMFT